MLLPSVETELAKVKLSDEGNAIVFQSLRFFSTCQNPSSGTHKPNIWKKFLPAGKRCHLLGSYYLYYEQQNLHLKRCVFSERKNSHKFQILGFFLKKIWIFREKNLNFFKIAEGRKFAAESVSIGMISQKCLFCPNYEVFFGKKIRKLSALEILENMMRKNCLFEKKNLTIFLKAFFTKMRRRKNAGGSRPSCFLAGQGVSPRLIRPSGEGPRIGPFFKNTYLELWGNNVDKTFSRAASLDNSKEIPNWHFSEEFRDCFATNFWCKERVFPKTLQSIASMSNFVDTITNSN